ncbi:MAG: recombinase family protein [Clostridia bacterium]|nr:recombinase family protein [Clostridia bacterium]
MEAAAYIRVAEHACRNAIELQKLMLQNYALAHDYKILGTFIDKANVRTSLYGRRGFGRMLKALELSADPEKAVLILTSEALSCNSLDFIKTIHEFRQRGVKVIKGFEGTELTRDVRFDRIRAVLEESPKSVRQVRRVSSNNKVFGMELQKSLISKGGAIQMNAAGYMNILSSENEEVVEHQQQALESFAKEKGYNISDYFVDYTSSTTNPYDRQGFNELLHSIMNSNEMEKVIFVLNSGVLSRDALKVVELVSELGRNGITVFAALEKKELTGGNPAVTIKEISEEMQHYDV